MSKPEVLTVVGARLNSSRLPGKHLMNLSGKPVIAHIFERLSALPGEKVLATTADTFNQRLIDWAINSDTLHFAFDGDVDDLVGRIDAIAQQHSPDYLIYICGDCPLVDPDFILTALNRLQDLPDYETIKLSSDAEGHSGIHEGIHLYSRTGWQKLVTASRSPLQREHVGLANNTQQPLLKALSLEERPEIYRLQQRISIDTPADLRFMDRLYNLWAGQGSPPLLWAIKTIEENPELALLNAHVQQKSGLKDYGKAIFICEAGSTTGLGQLTRTRLIAERLCEETGLGVELFIIGEYQKLEALNALNHQWFADAASCWSTLKRRSDSKLFFFDIFPQRLDDSHSCQLLLEHLHNQGATLLGYDHMWRQAEHLDLCIVPNPFFAPQDSVHNILSGQEYIVTPICEPAQNDHTYDLLISTGGSDAIKY